MPAASAPAPARAGRGRPRRAAVSWSSASRRARTMLTMTAPSWSPPSDRPRSSAIPSSVSCTGISSSSVTRCTAVCGERITRMHGVGVGPDRPDLGQPGHLGVDVEEPADPAGRRGVHHDRVVEVRPAVPAAGYGLVDLAGEQHVPQARRDRGREVDDAEPGQRPAGAPQVVEHLQVLEQRLLRGRRPARRRRRRAPSCPGATATLRSSVGQRRAVEQLGDALPALDLDEQDPAARRARASASAPATVVLPVPPLPVTTCSRTPSQSVSRALTGIRLSALAPRSAPAVQRRTEPRPAAGRGLTGLSLG